MPLILELGHEILVYSVHILQLPLKHLYQPSSHHPVGVLLSQEFLFIGMTKMLKAPNVISGRFAAVPNCLNFLIMVSHGMQNFLEIFLPKVIQM